MTTRPGLAAVAVSCGAQGLIGADGLAVAIALPRLAGDLGAEPVAAQWVLSAYGIAFGGGLLLGGRLGDVHGHRRLLVAGTLLFAAGSLGAALAPSLALLVAARAVQGAGAAAAVPATLALLGGLFPPGPERARALGALASAASLGVMAGLVVGGAITQLLGWRWVFGLAAPLALAVALAAPRTLPARLPGERPAALDALGAVLATAGLALLLAGLTGAEGGGALRIALPALAGVALLAAFAAWERRVPAPLVRPAVLRLASLRTAAIGAAVNAVAFTAVVYAGSLYVQEELGFGPLKASLALLPLDAVAFVVPLAAGAAIGRARPRALLAASLVASALALGWLAFEPDRYAPGILVPLLVLGASLPVAFVVLTQLAVAEVEPGDRGAASGVFETANHLFGGAVGVALYATVAAATGSYGAAFAVAAGLAGAGAAVVPLSARTPSRR